ncbi:protein translocase subunit SecF [Glutamicibacter protophormiae]|uniref:protein translocase subunit SecF n=1 Tax=Glutamicibacter protophormiae TaxID=37930 RepID=UPI0019590FF0|nr:protein translocase subunit SecF [Glutamicibacter protophormiae]QRQ77097.1 protein translocase subunit SecF [Glutamicibacter protophormiae]WPR63067.1 protein translocase subunit SecF [Glutamicibacter protophormiae]WPR66564.1 protein translocase subunit SecF [Glutamicibacter protophormiae]
MNKLVTWGNELYTGKRSYPFTSKHRLWFSIAAVLVVLSILLPVVKGGFNLGIDFRGGSEFTVSNTTHTEQGIGEQAVKAVAPEAVATVTNIAPGTMRIQTELLSDDQTLAIAKDLAAGYGVSANEVTSNFIGPTWGQDVSRQALVGLLVFVLLVGLLMAAYFRTWKMSLAALIGLFTVIVVTGGIYSLTGFEITPSAIIGFLTILSYSLYDTVVVFDKIRENTKDFSKRNERTFEQQVNLAVNQTLVRSINTSVVAVLPVAAILFIGSYLLGAGTLKDLSLALFVGIIVGTLSTIFIQAPLYAWLRRNDPEVVAHTKKLEAAAA